MATVTTIMTTAGTRVLRLLVCVRNHAPADDGVENLLESHVIEFREAQQVEMTHEARSDLVASTAGRAHRSDEVGVDDGTPRLLLEVIPVSQGKCRAKAG